MALFSTFLLSNIDSSLLFFNRISICLYFFTVDFQPWLWFLFTICFMGNTVISLRLSTNTHKTLSVFSKFTVKYFRRLSVKTFYIWIHCLNNLLCSVIHSKIMEKRATLYRTHSQVKTNICHRKMRSTDRFSD